MYSNTNCIIANRLNVKYSSSLHTSRISNVEVIRMNIYILFSIIHHVSKIYVFNILLVSYNKKSNLIIKSYDIIEISYIKIISKQSKTNIV